MMRKFFLCRFFIGLWKYISTLLGKLLCFVRKRKQSTQKIDNESVLMSIKVQGSETATETNLVDWNNWEDNGSGDGKPDQSETQPDELELFKDMEPVIDKTKVIHVKKTVRAPSANPSSSSQMNFLSGDKGLNGSNLNQKYQVEAELGVLEDENGTGGWDDEIDENFISKETETMIQSNKALERERRLAEQKQKKMDRDLQRAQKRQDNRIGVKIK